MTLAIKPPFAPMEALLVHEIPTGGNWQYEPKWDGFRCLAFRDGRKIHLQSKSGQPLTRYFPELVEAFGRLSATRFVLDGEVAVPGVFGVAEPKVGRVTPCAPSCPAVYRHPRSDAPYLSSLSLVIYEPYGAVICLPLSAGPSLSRKGMAVCAHSPGDG